jgi:hypothetical protein
MVAVRPVKMKYNMLYITPENQKYFWSQVTPIYVRLHTYLKTRQYEWKGAIDNLDTKTGYTFYVIVQRKVGTTLLGGPWWTGSGYIAYQLFINQNVTSFMLFEIAWLF